MNTQKIAFICSPYAGDTDNNVKLALLHCKFAYSKGYIPIAVHTMFTQFLDDGKPKEREDGINMGISLMRLLGAQAELWVFGDTISKGMEMEIADAHLRGMIVKHFIFTLKDKDGIDNKIQDVKDLVFHSYKTKEVMIYELTEEYMREGILYLEKRVESFSETTPNIDNKQPNDKDNKVDTDYIAHKLAEVVVSFAVHMAREFDKEDTSNCGVGCDYLQVSSDESYCSLYKQPLYGYITKTRCVKCQVSGETFPDIDIDIDNKDQPEEETINFEGGKII